MSTTFCPLCRHRRAKRACPALDQSICPVCCGTKRRIEIRCPDGCPYLATARTHPAATVRRRQVRDGRVLAALLHDLSDQQAQLLWTVHRVVDAHRTVTMPPLADSDLVDAIDAVAATLETAARGIIYAHAPRSLGARSLVAELQPLVTQAQRDRRLERDAILVLRRIERVARAARTTLEDSATAYLDFIGRSVESLGPRTRRLVAPVGGT